MISGTRTARRSGLLDCIGHTPLVRLARLPDRDDVEVWAKLEAANPGGSAKDRPAARMIEDAMDSGTVTRATTVIESSSGNMGVGLAQACRFHGLRFVCVVDSRSDPAKLATMRAYGAEVRVVTEPDRQTGDLLTARLHLVARLLETIPDSFWPDQYANPSNPLAHAEGTMREIDEALNGDVDHVFVATSTTGTLQGCLDFVRDSGRTTRVVAVDAQGSALFGGTRGVRRLPGLGAGVETELSRGAVPDGLVRVGDREAVLGCRRLMSREAVFAGASAGAVGYAFTQLAPELPAGSRCALILHDGGAGYLNTVYDDEWVQRELGLPPA